MYIYMYMDTYEHIWIHMYTYEYICTQMITAQHLYIDTYASYGTPRSRRPWPKHGGPAGAPAKPTLHQATPAGQAAAGCQFWARACLLGPICPYV